MSNSLARTILIALLLLLCACNGPDEEKKGNPASGDNPTADSGQSESDTGNEPAVEDAVPAEEQSAQEPDASPENYPRRSYTEAQLQTFEELLAVNPVDANRRLLEDGAVLNSDYLNKYIESGATNMVVRMISAGMELNEPAENGMRPLSKAVLVNDPYLIELMIEHGADPLLRDAEEGGFGRSLLHYATKADNVELVERLLELGVEVDIVDMHDQTPLDVAATFGESASMKVLLEHGADPMRQDDAGSVPLLLSAAYGHLEATRLLIEHGADVNYRDERGWTPLLLSLQYNHNSTAELLLEHGADATAVNGLGIGAAALAASVGNAPLLRSMIDAGAPLDTFAYKEGRNLIHLCVANNLQDFIDELVQAGLDPNAADAEGIMPVDIAIRQDNEKAIEILRPYMQAAGIELEERRQFVEGLSNDAS